MTVCEFKGHTIIMRKGESLGTRLIFRYFTDLMRSLKILSLLQNLITIVINYTTQKSTLLPAVQTNKTSSSNKVSTTFIIIIMMM